MITRRHPVTHLFAILALLAGQFAMASTACDHQMVAGMDGARAVAGHAGHHAPASRDDASTHPAGHPCCACTCPCRADVARFPALAAITKPGTATTRPMPPFHADRPPPSRVPTILPPVRAPPAIA